MPSTRSSHVRLPVLTDWITGHQENIRADLFVGLEDALNRDDAVPENPGRWMILPSSFITGSDRHMQQLYQDSMAMEVALDLRPIGVDRERNRKCRRSQVPHNGHGP
ncbi:hypothetical protein E4U61_005926 [Claviceps capensis]|nr:hypothetical protein E4U61_005926 [Claviceps capensis]